LRLIISHFISCSNLETVRTFFEGGNAFPPPPSKKVARIVKRCFWIQIKFITEDSNAIHTIITTILLKLNEAINLKLFTTEGRSTKQARLGFMVDSVLIKREA
jgi:hypothetical protein